MVLLTWVVDAVWGDVDANGPTARCSLWGWMSLRRATARVWEGLSLIHTVSARVAAGLRQSLMMPMFVRLWVVSDTLVGGAPMRGMVWSSLRVRASCLALCWCWASWGGVYVCVLWLLVGAVCRVEGGGGNRGRDGGWGAGNLPVLPMCTVWSRRSLAPVCAYTILYRYNGVQH